MLKINTLVTSFSRVILGCSILGHEIVEKTEPFGVFNRVKLVCKHCGFLKDIQYIKNYKLRLPDPPVNPNLPQKLL